MLRADSCCAAVGADGRTAYAAQSLLGPSSWTAGAGCWLLAGYCCFLVGLAMGSWLLAGSASSGSATVVAYWLWLCVGRAGRGDSCIHG